MDSIWAQPRLRGPGEMRRLHGVLSLDTTSRQQTRADCIANASCTTSVHVVYLTSATIRSLQKRSLHSNSGHLAGLLKMIADLGLAGAIVEPACPNRRHRPRRARPGASDTTLAFSPTFGASEESVKSERSAYYNIIVACHAP